MMVCPNTAGLSRNVDMLENEQPAPGLWKFIPIEQYELPCAPAKSVASDRWHKFKQIFVPTADSLVWPPHKDHELHGFSAAQLQHLVPSLRWEASLEALDDALAAWRLAENDSQSVQYVVTPPHVNRSEILRLWAQRHRAQVMDPPSIEAVLAGDFDKLPQAASGLWVVPNLERFFLRHANGLDLVRELLNRLHSSSGGKYLLGCDSWSWSYLNRVCGTSFSSALTLQAFDARCLERLILGMTQLQDSQRICFVNAQNGHNILTVPGGIGDSGLALEHLASHCRGNVATAVTYWRESLRSTRPEAQTADETAPVVLVGAGQDVERQIWVTSLLPHTAMPAGKDEDALLLLHCLLLHGGLSTPLLALAMPVSSNRVDSLIERMRQMGLLHELDGVWQVRPLAYAAVREILVGHDYLVDDF